MTSDFYRRCFVIGTVLVLGYALLRVLEPLLGPLLWAALLAFLVYPLQVRLSRRLRGHDGWSAAILTCLAPFVILAPLALLGLLFVQQATMLIGYWRAHPLHVDYSLFDRLHDYPAFGPPLRWIAANMPVSSDQLQNWLMQRGQALLAAAAASSGTVFLLAFGTIVGFIFMLFLFYFFVRDGRQLVEKFSPLIPMQPDRARRLLNHLGDVVLALVLGTGLTAMIQGTFVGIGFALAGLPSPIVFGVVATFASLLPALGSGLVLVPAILALMMQGRWGAAIFLAVWSIGVSFADNALRPVLVARHAPVSSLAVFVGVIGGLAAFGAIGLVLGPLLLSLIGSLLRLADESVGRRD